MDFILQACTENVLNVLVEQDGDFDNPLDSLPPSRRIKFLRSKKTREMNAGEIAAHRIKPDQLTETEESLANEDSNERSRFNQRRETEERLNEVLRTMYETETGVRPQPVAESTISLETDPPDVARDADDSDTDPEDSLKEEERGLQRSLQRRNIVNRKLERERQKNKVLSDMLLAIRNRLNTTS